MILLPSFSFFFFFNDTATTEIYTLSLHDALPISRQKAPRNPRALSRTINRRAPKSPAPPATDRKSTRLNSSHSQISYAVFCLKKKKKKHSNNYAHSTTLQSTTTYRKRHDRFTVNK